MRAARTVFAVLGASLLWAACGTLFNIRIEDTATTTVEAATPLEVLLSDFGFGEFVAMDLTQAQELRNQGVEPGDISEVTFRELTLTVTSPPNGDLSFIDELEFWVSAPGLPRVRVASQSSFPDGAPSVSMILDDQDLTEYVVSESMTIETEITASRPQQRTTVDAFYAIRVGVTQQGCNNYQNQ